MEYTDYISRKLSTVTPTGIRGTVDLPASLFPHQRALTGWAIKRGRAAIFADTGLGKSRMEVAWADAVRKETGMPVLILAPLAVAAQTAQEAAQIGIEVTVCRDGKDVNDRGINITNYDRLHRFNPAMFGGVVLDESSIIKHHDAKTFGILTAAFRDTPFKLPATATPAPNDWTELGTHAEFLGICSRQEMLAEFFTHDGGDTSVWRLKGHARQAFWRWVCAWGALIRRPSDLGFDDNAYALPPLHLHEHQVEVDMPSGGMLFAMEAQTLSERREARRMSMEDRVRECVATIYGEWGVHGLETRIRGSAQGERDGGSVASGEKVAVSQRESRAQQGIAKGVHEGVLRDKPGKVQAIEPGATCDQECQSQKEVRGERGVARSAQSIREGVADDEPRKEEGAALTQIQDNASAACGNAGESGRSVRDLPDGSGWPEELPDGGSLPCDGKSSRASLLELQSGHRQVQGQPRSSTGGDSVSLEPWIIWCELNAEQDQLERAFGDLAFSVRGSDSIEDKESRILGWLAGDRPVIISKPSILGFGLNMQRASRMAFVGVTDSYEAYYQAIRRCWRFGQKRDVHAHIFSSKAEGAVVANLKRKEREAAQMAEALSAETHDAVMTEVTGSTRQSNTHNAGKSVNVPSFLRAA